MIKIYESSNMQLIYRQTGLKIEKLVSFFFFFLGTGTKRKLTYEEKKKAAEDAEHKAVTETEMRASSIIVSP